MKTENNLYNKAIFFSNYFGQGVVFVSGALECTQPVCGDIIERMHEYDNPQLKLRKLDTITDEEAIEVAKIYGWGDCNDQQQFKDRILQFKIDLPCIAIAGYKHKHLLPVFDYLRSKGFALPWRDLSIDDLINYGWIKLIEHP